MTATKCFIDNFLVWSDWQFFNMLLRNWMNRLLLFKESREHFYLNCKFLWAIFVGLLRSRCQHRHATLLPGDQAMFCIFIFSWHLNTRNEKARDFKMEVFSSSFASVAFKEALLKSKIIPWINVQVLSGDGLQLSTVTGIRFYEMKCQTLQESRNLSTGFRRSRVLNFKVNVIVFLKPHL